MDVREEVPLKGRLSDQSPMPKRLSGRLSSGLMDDNSWIQNSGNNKRSIKGETVKSVERSSLPGRLKGKDSSWITNTTQSRKTATEDPWLRSTLRSVRTPSSASAGEDSWLSGGSANSIKKRYTSPGRLQLKAGDAQGWVKNSEGKEPKARSSSDSVSDVKARFELKARMEASKDDRSWVGDNIDRRSKITARQVKGSTVDGEEDTMSRKSRSEIRQRRVMSSEFAVTNPSVPAKEERNGRPPSVDNDNNENGLASTESDENHTGRRRRRRRRERSPESRYGIDETDVNANINTIYYNNNNEKSAFEENESSDQFTEHKSLDNDGGHHAQKLWMEDENEMGHCFEGQDCDIEFQKRPHKDDNREAKIVVCGVIASEDQLNRDHEIDTTEAEVDLGERKKTLVEKVTDMGELRELRHLHESAFEDPFSPNIKTSYFAEEKPYSDVPELSEGKLLSCHNFGGELDSTEPDLCDENINQSTSPSEALKSEGSDLNRTVDSAGEGGSAEIRIARGRERVRSIEGIGGKEVSQSHENPSMNSPSSESETYIQVTKEGPAAETQKLDDVGEPIVNEDKRQSQLMDGSNNHDSCNLAPEKRDMGNGSSPSPTSTPTSESKLAFSEEESAPICTTEETGSSGSNTRGPPTCNSDGNISVDVTATTSDKLSTWNIDSSYEFISSPGMSDDNASATQSVDLLTWQESIDSVDGFIPVTKVQASGSEGGSVTVESDLEITTGSGVIITQSESYEEESQSEEIGNSGVTVSKAQIVFKTETTNAASPVESEEKIVPTQLSDSDLQEELTEDKMDAEKDLETLSRKEMNRDVYKHIQVDANPQVNEGDIHEDVDVAKEGPPSSSPDLLIQDSPCTEHVPKPEDISESTGANSTDLLPNPETGNTHSTSNAIENTPSKNVLANADSTDESMEKYVNERPEELQTQQELCPEDVTEFNNTEVVDSSGEKVVPERAPPKPEEGTIYEREKTEETSLDQKNTSEANQITLLTFDPSLSEGQPSELEAKEVIAEMEVVSLNEQAPTVAYESVLVNEDDHISEGDNYTEENLAGLDDSSISSNIEKHSLNEKGPAINNSDSEDLSLEKTELQNENILSGVMVQLETQKDVVALTNEGEESKSQPPTPENENEFFDEINNGGSSEKVNVKETENETQLEASEIDRGMIEVENVEIYEHRFSPQPPTTEETEDETQLETSEIDRGMIEEENEVIYTHRFSPQPPTTEETEDETQLEASGIDRGMIEVENEEIYTHRFSPQPPTTEETEDETQFEASGIDRGMIEMENVEIYKHRFSPQPPTTEETEETLPESLSEKGSSHEEVKEDDLLVTDNASSEIKDVENSITNAMVEKESRALKCSEDAEESSRAGINKTEETVNAIAYDKFCESSGSKISDSVESQKVEIRMSGTKRVEKIESGRTENNDSDRKLDCGDTASLSPENMLESGNVKDREKNSSSDKVESECHKRELSEDPSKGSNDDIEKKQDKSPNTREVIAPQVKEKNKKHDSEEIKKVKVTYDNRYYIPVDYAKQKVARRYRLSRKSESVMVNEDVCWDTLILEVFEESDTIYFPLQTQKEARSFVKALHLKGHSFQSMCIEIGEHEHNFNSWRKSLGRAGIGNAVMLWANRPLQDLLDDSDDDFQDQDEDVTDGATQSIEEDRKREIECQERLQPKVSENGSKKSLDFNKNDKKQADLTKEPEKIVSTSRSSSRDSKSVSPQPQPKEVKELKQKYDQEPDPIRLRRIEEFKKEMGTGSLDEEAAMRDVRKRISMFENKTSPSKSNSESREDVSKENDEESSKTRSESESVSSGSPDESSIEPEETKTQEVLAPKKDEEIKDESESESESEDEADAEEQVEEKKEPIVEAPPPKVVEKVEEKSEETKVAKSSPSNGHAPKSEEPKPAENAELPGVDENYNSDLDPENDMQSPMLTAAVKKISATRSNKNWSGFLFVFSDTPGNSETCRVKLGVSSFPHKRLRQAQLFNPNIYQVKIMAVKQRATALHDVLSELDNYRMANQKDWFEGPFNELLSAISGVASRYPSSRKILSQDDDDNEESAC